ncbi:MAG: glutamyl-tRNA reductase [Nitrososphaerota archaeon]
MLENLYGFLLNHKNVPIARLDKAAYKDLDFALRVFKEIDGVLGVAIIQTCNRVELYVELSSGRDPGYLIEFWEELVEDQELSKDLTIIRGVDVIRHIFRLASGLESMVIGEQEILRQVKDAYYKALTIGSLSRTMKIIFQEAIRLGKKIRTETEIDKRRLSLPQIAVEVVEKMLRDLNDKVIMIIGAGETGELVNSTLVGKSYRKLTLLFANRTYEKAKQLANISGGIALQLNEIPNYLPIADIVFVTTSAPHYILTREKVEEALEKREKPLIIVDLSVPRNVDPEISEISSVKLLTLDDIKEYVDEYIYDKMGEVKKVENIVEKEVERFLEKFESMQMNEIISKIYKRIENIRLEELEEALSMIRKVEATVDERTLKIMECMSKAIVKRIMNPFIENLKKNYRQLNYNDLVNLLQLFFDTEDPDRIQSKH